MDEFEDEDMIDTDDYEDSLSAGSSTDVETELNDSRS